MRVGVTGHLGLTEPSIPLIYGALVTALRRFPRLRGVTCLAPGSDQLFARAVQALGAQFDVIVPVRREVCGSYAGWPVEPLLGRARRVSYLRFDRPGEAAYLAASTVLLNRCEHLVAVWDGDPRGAPGGTADTVARAADRRIPVTVVWPPGAARADPPMPLTGGVTSDTAAAGSSAFAPRRGNRYGALRPTPPTQYS